MVLEQEVGDSLVSQVNAMVAAGRWPRDPPPAGHMRGIDFYNQTDLMVALIVGAQIFKDSQGYIPPLAAPVTYTERLFARKFFAPLPMPSLADKLEGQAYVRARMGEAFVPSVVWVGESADELFAAQLPAGRFVLKANHGCRYNLVLSLPEDLVTRREDIQTLTAGWLATRFGFETGEWQYCTFKPKLFLEEFIPFNGDSSPDEYKLYCFRGRVGLVNLHLDRFTSHRGSLYDTDWNLLPASFGREVAYRERPRNLEAIVEAAERIAAGLSFARIDLYSDGEDQLKFSEITFTPGNSTSRLSDRAFDARLGALVDVGT